MLALVPVALGVATLTFAIIHLVPGDPIVVRCSVRAAAPGRRCCCDASSDGPGPSTARTVRVLSRWARRRRSRRIDFVSQAGRATDRRALSCDDRTRGGGNDRRDTHRVSARNNFGLQSGRCRRSWRDGFRDRRHLGAAHLSRAPPDDFVLARSPMAPAHRPRRFRAPRLTRSHTWHRACRDSRTDAAPEPDSRARERLHAHRAQQGTQRTRRAGPPRFAQRAHFGGDDHRTSDGRAAQRHTHN